MWDPSKGDKVLVTDDNYEKASGVIVDGWASRFTVRMDHGETRYVHIRNLDPDLPDERKGAPRPIKIGDKVHVVLTSEVSRRSFGLGANTYINEIVPVDDARVRQIERRKHDL